MNSELFSSTDFLFSSLRATEFVKFFPLHYDLFWTAKNHEENQRRNVLGPWQGFSSVMCHAPIMVSWRHWPLPSSERQTVRPMIERSSQSSDRCHGKTLILFIILRLYLALFCVLDLSIVSGPGEDASHVRCAWRTRRASRKNHWTGSARTCFRSLKQADVGYCREYDFFALSCTCQRKLSMR